MNHKPASVVKHFSDDGTVIYEEARYFFPNGAGAQVTTFGDGSMLVRRLDQWGHDTITQSSIVCESPADLDDVLEALAARVRS